MTLSKVKRIFAHPASRKGLVSNICKEFLQVTNKKTTQLNGMRKLCGHLPEENS